MISTKCLNIREVGNWKFKVQCPVLPGTCPGLAAERAATVPRAAPAPTIKPNLINNDRVFRCFGGAIATPAGFEAAPPLTWTGGATAVPVGCDDCAVCALLAVEFPCGALLEPALTLPGLSGNSTGVALEFEILFQSIFLISYGSHDFSGLFCRFDSTMTKYPFHFTRYFIKGRV